MKKEHLVFLIVGFAFGILVGIGTSRALHGSPNLGGSNELAQRPAGPMAPTQVGTGDGGGAPMMAEIRALKKRVEDDPQDHAALVRLANLFHDASMFDEAIGYYESALKLRPNAPDQLTDMGICYRGKREFERALELFEQAHKADPDHWQSLFNYVVVAGFDLGRFEPARQALEAMEQMNPRPPRLDELRQALEQAEAGAGPAEG